MKLFAKVKAQSQSFHQLKQKTKGVIKHEIVYGLIGDQKVR